MVPYRSTARLLLVLAPIALPATACSDDLTGPSSEQQVIHIDNSQLAGTQVAVTDATERVFPAVAQLPGANELGAALDALSRAVARANAIEVDQGVTRAERALAQVRLASPDAVASELDVIEFAILDAARSLTYSTPAAARREGNS